MKCEEVQEQLSEYLEKLLDGGVARAIESHLTACARCTETLTDLSQCQSLVAALPQVEPPPGFTTRVMAHVRETAGQPRWWQRLFFPPRIKLPIQATAVLLIGVLSVYLLQKDPSHKQILQPPETKAWVDTAEDQPKLELRRGSTGAQESPITLFRRAETPEEPRQSTTRKEPLTAFGKPVPSTENETIAARLQSLPAKKESPVSPAAARDSAKRATNAPAEPAALPMSLANSSSELPAQAPKLITGAIGVSQRLGASTSPMAGAMEGLYPERGLRGPFSERARFLPTTPLADVELVVRRRALPRQESAARESPSSLRNLEESDNVKTTDGRTTAVRPTGSAPTVGMTSWQTIPANRYEQYKKDLVTQGTIESETPLAAQDSLFRSDQLLTIKLTILPPLPNDSAR